MASRAAIGQTAGMAGDGLDGQARSDGAPSAAGPAPSSQGDPDADLVAAAVAGDRDAFGTLIDRHYDRIHALAWQLTGSRSDAEDIAQDVCCALVRRIGSFRGEARFSTWLCGITFNACRDARRRGRAFRGLTERLAVIAGIGRGGDHADLHDAMWVKSAVMKLPAAYRDTVVLVAGQQLTHAEAATILGVAEATVSWRLHEARKRLGGGV
ncbi:sigma-70 family RNA polymerase sigma factor [Sphingomonas sp. S6]|jgi:RNA polymerase sigma factor (sigma-70 family)|uniref:RNA polymerase sigma factor n=1 Tax=Sphingomonas sp. S6 TaxID=3368600 RepID=UPI0028EAB988|nr:sigma-70 family RNA polymerase sigma factor [uncultured Sphingomonas sp.]